MATLPKLFNPFAPSGSNGATSNGKGMLGHVAPPGEPGPPRIGPPIGGSGRVNVWGILQQDEYNRKLIGPQGLMLYDEMYRTDPDIGRLVLMVWSPIQAGSWTLNPHGGDDATDLDREIADTIWEGLNTYMAPNFLQHLGEVGKTLLPSGFAPFEQVWGLWERKGKTLTFPRSLQVRLPRTIWRWPQDDYGELVEISQILPTRGQVTIPIDSLVYYRLSGQGDNWMGESLLRRAYKPWLYKDKLERIDAIGQERKAVGVPVVYPPQNADSDTKAQVEAILANLHVNEVGYIMSPGPKQGLTGMSPGEGWLFDVIKFDSSSGESIQQSLTYHKLAIAGSFLGDFMELGHHQVGAKATAQVQEDPFLTAVQGLTSHVIPPLDKLIARITEVNWANADGAPTLSLNLTDAASLAEIALYVQPLIAAGAMQADPELEDWLRQRADMPAANAEIRVMKQAASTQALKNAALPPEQQPGYQPPGQPSNGQPGAKAPVNSEGETKQFATPTVKWWENLLSQGKLKEALDGARESVETAAKEPAALLARHYASQAAGGMEKSAPDLGGLADAIHSAYAGLYTVGHQTVQTELAAQRAKGLMTPSQAAAAAGARLARAKVRAGLSAANVAHAITSRLSQAQTSGLSDSTALQDLAVTAGLGALHLEALNNAAATINDGRFDAAVADGGAVGAYYTSVLDGNTCGPCEEADTGDLLSLDDAESLGPPNPDCDGGDRCRCMLVFVTSEDPTAATV